MGAQNLVPPGFDPQIIQHVASRYTDYAALAHRVIIRKCFYINLKMGLNNPAIKVPVNVAPPSHTLPYSSALFPYL
jgi:hypothetical protein